VLLRGREVYADGRVAAAAGTGVFVPGGGAAAPDRVEAHA
jgi:hypothetical protein